jgi:hypothetical protein
VVKRIAPVGGYVGGTKQHYRRDVWATFRRSAIKQGWSRRESHCLLMPSIEGNEIDIALRNGFSVDHLHVVDMNPAIVAHLKRKYPRINTYGVRVSDAAERIAKSAARLRFANLDLCGNVGAPLVRELDQFGGAGCLDDVAYVAVTMLRGREKRGMLPHVDDIPAEKLERLREKTHRALPARDYDALRLSAASGALLGGFTPGEPWHSSYFMVRSGIYHSTAGHQTMLWFVQMQVKNRLQREGAL